MSEEVYGIGFNIGEFDYSSLHLGDNEIQSFGDSTDNAIYHDGTDSGDFVFNSHYDTTTSNYHFKGGDATFDGTVVVGAGTVVIDSNSVTGLDKSILSDTNAISVGDYRDYRLGEDFQNPVINDFGKDWTHSKTPTSPVYPNETLVSDGAQLILWGSLRSEDRGITWNSSVLLPDRQLCYLGGNKFLGADSNTLTLSNDGGILWTDSTTLPATPIRGCYLGNGIVLVGTQTPTTMLRSTDYGATWTALGSFSDTTNIPCITALSDGTVLAGTSKGADGTAHIFRSTDYGQTWANTEFYYSIASGVMSMAYGGNGVVVAGMGYPTSWGATGAFVSNDAGQTWVAGSGATGTGYNNSYVTYMGYGVFVLSQSGTADVEGVRVSYDYGTTWSYTSTNYGIPYNAGSGACLLGRSGYVYRSSIFGAQINPPFDSSSGIPIYLPEQSRETTGFEINLQNDGLSLFDYEHSGMFTQEKSVSSLPAWSYPTAINFGSGHSLLAEGDYYGLLYRTYDYGETWIPGGLTDAGGTYVVSYMAYNPDQTTCVGIRSTTVRRSFDYGYQWSDTTVLTGVGSPRTIAYAGNDVFLIGTSESCNVLRSTDNGANWTNIGSICTLSDSSTVRDICYLGNGVIVAACIGTDSYQNTKVIRSTDNGATWTFVARMGDITSDIKCFASAGNGIAIFLTKGQAWKTVDYGLSWYNVRTVHGSINYNQVLYLGKGTFLIESRYNPTMSVDYGETWVGLPDYDDKTRSQYLGKGRVIRSGYNTGAAKLAYSRNEEIDVIAVSDTDKEYINHEDYTVPYGQLKPVTEDFGKDWANAGRQFLRMYVTDMATAGNGVVIASAYESGTTPAGYMIRSADYGKNWNTVYGGDSTMQVYATAYCGDGTFVGSYTPYTGSDTKLIQSGDYGASWSDTTVSNQFVWSLGYLGNDVVVAGTRDSGAILRSTDKGSTWTDLGQQADSTTIRAIIGSGEGVSYAVADTRIIKSTDYGATWAEVFDTGVTLYEIEYLGNNVYVACGANYIYRSIDGNGWYAATASLGVTVYHMTYVGRGTVIAGASGGRIYRSDDYGSTWTNLGQQYSQTEIDTVCHVGNGIVLAGTGTASASGGLVLRSTNAADVQEDLVSDNEKAYTIFEEASLRSGRSIGSSIDPGLDWDSGQSLGGSVRAISSSGNGIAIAGAGQYIQRSDDFGTTWSRMYGTGGSTDIYSSCYVNAGIFLAGTGSGSGLGHILRSDDYGIVWSDSTVTSEDEISALCYLGEGVALAGTDGSCKVLRSTDSGSTWTDLGQQYAGATKIAAITNKGNGVVYAAAGTHILISYDYVATWSDQGASYVNALASLKYIEPDLWLAGSDFGLLISHNGKSFARVAGNTGIYWKMNDIEYMGNGVILVTGVNTGAGSNRSMGLRSDDYGENWTQVLFELTPSGYSLCNMGNGIALMGWASSVSRSANLIDRPWPEPGISQEEYVNESIAVENYNKGLVNNTAEYWDSTGHISTPSSIYTISTSGDGMSIAGIAGASSLGNIFFSGDYGHTWQDVYQTSAGITQVRSSAYLGGGIYVAGTGSATGNYGHILRSNDYGASWVDMTSTDQTEIMSLASFGDKIVVAGTKGDGRILRSEDLGNSWTDLGQQVSGGISIGAMTYAGHGKGYAASDDDILYTEDYGETWTHISTAPGTVLSMIYIDTKDLLVIGLNGVCYYSYNGRTFVASTSGGQVIGPVSLTYMGDGVVLFGGNGNGSGGHYLRVFKSIDYGKSFTVKVDLPVSLNAINIICNMGNKIAIVGGNTGDVYRTVGRSVPLSLTSVVNTDPRELSVVDSGKVFTNADATALVEYTLPTGPIGANYSFAVLDTDGLRVNAQSGQYIRTGEYVSSSGGYIDTTTVGGTIQLTLVDSDNWIAFSMGDSWNIS